MWYRRLYSWTWTASCDVRDDGNGIGRDIARLRDPILKIPPLGNNILEHHFDALQNPRRPAVPVTLARWCVSQSLNSNGVALALVIFSLLYQCF